MWAKKRKEKEEKEYTQRFPAVGQLSCRTCKAVATSGQCLNTVVVVVQHDQHLTKFANICLLANGRQPRVASPQLPKSVLFVLLRPTSFSYLRPEHRSTSRFGFGPPQHSEREAGQLELGSRPETFGGAVVPGGTRSRRPSRVRVTTH